MNVFPLKAIRQDLAANKRIRAELPDGGLLFLDRSLPFICVYRRVNGPEDHLSENLIRGESSFLIYPGSSSKWQPKYHALLKQIVEVMSQTFGGILIAEVWPEANPPKDADATPYFRIISNESDDLGATISSLSGNLNEIKILKRKAKVETHYIKRICSPQGSLLTRAFLEKHDAHHIGLEVRPIYQGTEPGEKYPLVARRLQRGISHALRRSYYTYTLGHTSHRPEHYHSLGRRTLTRAVQQVDASLAGISESFDFLLLSTPINPEPAWRAFKRAKFQKAPVFHYRPLPIDPPELKKKLYNIRISRIEDATLASLFREKRNEIDRQLTMLMDRGSKDFLYGSLQLYGPVKEPLLKSAVGILEKLMGNATDRTKKGYFTAEQFAARVQQEYDQYSIINENFRGTTKITEKFAGLIVSKGTLRISSDSRIPAPRVEALIQHEVGTHVLTHFNGAQQPFRLLSCGLAGYDELQEGIAVLSEYLVDGLSRGRLRLLAGRVVASHAMVDGSDFIETFRLLIDQYGFDQESAYTITMRTYRGGGLTKDAVYLRGLIRLIEHLNKGGVLANLLIGKIGFQHLPIIQELRHRNIVKAPSVLPTYLNAPPTEKKFSKLRENPSLVRLIAR